jgi:hypothetical protein
MYIPSSFEGVGNKQLMKVILMQNDLRGNNTKMQGIAKKTREIES